MAWTANDYLMHHGILGMRWGKKNGPPYPLDPSDHSASERKAGWRKSLDKGSGDEKTGKKSRSKEPDTEATSKRKGLTDKQKKILKAGAVAAASGLAIWGAYKLGKMPELDKLTSMGKNVINGLDLEKRINDIRGLDNVKPPEKQSYTVSEATVQSCAANINPSGSKTNCGSTSTAVIQNMIDGPGTYEAHAEVPEHMRKGEGKGYDPDKLIDCYEGASWTKMPSELQNRKRITKALEDEILSYGNDAKGIFYIERIRGKSTGHFFSWVVLHNKVHVVEGQRDQAGIVWNKDLYQDVGQLMDPMFDVKVARLDNHPIKPGREADLFKRRT